MSACPSEDDLERLLAGGVGLAAGVRAHAESCDRCTTWVREARADEAVLDGLRRGHAAEIGFSPPALGLDGESGAQEVPGLSRYRLLRKIGEGGMGIVYEAEQRNPRRRVALKLLRAGALSPALLRRFEHETQVLGRLDHPGIARIHEADTFEGPGGTQPFFAMELLRGRPFLEHVRDARLDVRAILVLVAEVCDAVEHAHQKGVIHRDLKPANLLVTEEGRPKVLDFGVARTTDADVRTATLQTDVGQLVGTLPYMSPEQLAGDPALVDTRSDVYALGVLLFESLAGRLPFGDGKTPVSQVARAIAERDPPRLGSIDRRLRGDVETIVAKALEKEKDRRYPSASALAEDLRRHLRHEPIAARPASAVYLLAKFARGHRALVASLAALFVALALGVVGVGLQAKRAQDAEGEAVARAEEAEEALEFLVEAYGVGAGATPLATTVQEALEDAVRRLGERGLSPRVESTVQLVIGNAYRRQGEPEKAEGHLERALELRRAAYGERHPKVAGAMNVLGALRHDQGRPEDAETLYRRALAIYRDVEGDGAPQVPTILLNLAQALEASGRLEEATRLCEESIALGRRAHGEAHEQVVQALAVRAAFHFRHGEREAAEARYREALAGHRATFGPDHPATAHCLWGLANLLFDDRAISEAASLAREAVEIERRHRADHPEFPGNLHRLGQILAQGGDLAAASAAYEESHALRRTRLGPIHPDTIRVAMEHARLLGRLREWASARKILEEVVAALGEEDIAEGEGRSGQIRVRGNLGNLLLEFDGLEGAEAAYRQALAILPPGEERLAGVLRNNLAGVLARKGDFAAADSILLDLVAERRSLDDSASLAIALNNLGEARRRGGDLAEAERDLREAVDLAARAHGEGHSTTAIFLANLAAVLVDAGRLAEAEPLFAQAIPVLEGNLPPAHPTRAEALAEHGRCLLRLGRHDEAEAALLASLEALEGASRPPEPDTLEALRDLVALYAATGRPDDEARARTRLAALE